MEPSAPRSAAVNRTTSTRPVPSIAFCRRRSRSRACGASWTSRPSISAINHRSSARRSREEPSTQHVVEDRDRVAARKLRNGLDERRREGHHASRPVPRRRDRRAPTEAPDRDAVAWPHRRAARHGDLRDDVRGQPTGTVQRERARADGDHVGPVGEQAEPRCPAAAFVVVEPGSWRGVVDASGRTRPAAVAYEPSAPPTADTGRVGLLGRDEAALPAGQDEEVTRYGCPSLHATRTAARPPAGHDPRSPRGSPHPIEGL